MNKVIVILALALATGTGFVLLTLGGGTARGAAAGTERAARPERADDDRPRAELAGDAAGEPGEVALPATTADETPSRTAAAVAPAVPPGEGFEVRVVLRDGTPVPDAEVRAVPLGEHAGAEAPGDLDRIDAWIDEHGLRLRADAEGVVRVPSDGEGPTVVVARAEGLWGHARLAAPPPEADELPRVTLDPDESLAALVVDADGRPVEGVRVELGRTRPHGWYSELRDRSTGAGGLARFAHVQAHRRWREDGEGAWSLRVEALFERSVKEELDPTALPAAPVRLTVGATGRVVVSVLDAEGRPWRSTTEVRLEAIRAGEPRELSPFGGSTRPSVEVTTEDGVARFPHVGLGLDLAVSARRDGGQVAARAYGRSPESPDEAARIPIRFGVEGPVVQVRALGPDGAPLAGRELLVQVEMGTRFLSSTAVARPTTDDEGRLRFDLPPLGKEGDRRTAEVIAGSRDEPEAVGVIDLARKLGPGLHDLGDLRLDPPRVFVRGRVVDALGAGVEGARLRLARHVEGRGWDSVWQFQATSDAHGAFEVQAHHEGERFRISAEKPGYAGEPVDFARGDTVTVQIVAAGSIVGSVLVDDGVPPGGLAVRARPVREREEEPALFSIGHSASPDEDGAFAIGSLAAGTYTVEITAEHGGEKLHEVSDVEVVGGVDVADPRLQRVDLRGRLHAITLTLEPPEDFDGRLQGSLRFGPAGAEELDRHVWLHETELDLLVTTPAIDVDLAPRGFVRVELRGLREDRTIALSRGIAVRVRLVGGAKLPERPVFIKPALAPEDEPGSIDWSTPPFAEDQREVTIRGLEPGPVHLTWILVRQSGNAAMATSRDANPPQVFQVLPGVEDQVFEVSLSPAELESLLEGFAW